MSTDEDREFDARTILAQHGITLEIGREFTLEQLETLAATVKAWDRDDDEDDQPEPDWRFEWELVGRTRGKDAGDYVLHHKSDGRYRIIHEEDW